VRSTCFTGTAPNKKPLTIVSTSATRYTRESGVKGMLSGKRGIGLHTVIALRSITLPQMPTAPPSAEISSASVKICRTIRA
jgi:hypothetical protein